MSGGDGGRLSFLRSSGYATVTAGSAIMLVALTMIAGRWLPASEYGKFSFAIALATIIETIMDTGLGPVTVRTVARDGAGAGTLFRHVLGLKVAWGALGLVTLLVAAPIMRSDPTVIRACYLMGASSAIRSYVLSARGLLQGLNRFDLETVTVVADRGLLLAIGTLVLISGFGLYGLSVAFVIARIAMFVVVTVIVKRVAGSAVPTYDRAVWIELQTAALPLGFFLITLTLYTYIDTVILGIMRTDAETGWYAASYRVYEGLMYAPSAFATVLTPRLSRLLVADLPGLRALFRRSLLASALMALVIGGAAMLLARPLMMLFYGPAYEAAVPPLQVLAGGSLFVFCTWILHSAAIAMNLDRRLVATTAIGLITNIALNILFIPRQGITGAAWATVIAEAVTVVLLYFQVNRRLAEAQPLTRP
jgi:O-antigen/teichoic acid export membrane protein